MFILTHTFRPFMVGKAWCRRAVHILAAQSRRSEMLFSIKYFERITTGLLGTNDVSVNKARSLSF